MASNITLSPFAASILAATVTAVRVGGNLDYRYDGTQNRRVVVTLASAADSVLLEGSLDLVNWFTVVAAFTGATTPFITALSGPYQGLRVTKTGTNGAATVQAIV